MGFYVQMWLPLLAIALTAAICFSVAWFIMERREASSNIISTSHQPISPTARSVAPTATPRRPT